MIEFTVTDDIETSGLELIVQERTPLELANETLLYATTVEQVEAMNKRVCDYLGKMGIKVN